MAALKVFHLNTESMASLRQLSNDPEIAQDLKTITISALRFRDDASFRLKNLQTTIQDRVESDFGLDGEAAQRAIGRACMALQSTIMATRDMDYSGEIVPRLAEILSRFPKLERIILLKGDDIPKRPRSCAPSLPAIERGIISRILKPTGLIREIYDLEAENLVWLWLDHTIWEMNATDRVRVELESEQTNCT